MSEKFVPVVCEYDPQVDIEEVDQFGFVDLRAAYETHTIPGDLTASEESFNGVEDPDSLLGRASDVFDSIRKGQRVENSKAAAEANASSSADTE